MAIYGGGMSMAMYEVTHPIHAYLRLHSSSVFGPKPPGKWTSTSASANPVAADRDADDRVP